MKKIKLFLIQHDNGLDDELRETKTLGVYDNLEMAKKFLFSNGFHEGDKMDGEELFFLRYEDFAIIIPIELNKPIKRK